MDASSGRFFIDGGYRELAQRVVGFLLFSEGLAEQLHRSSRRRSSSSHVHLRLVRRVDQMTRQMRVWKPRAVTQLLRCGLSARGELRKRDMSLKPRRSASAVKKAVKKVGNPRMRVKKRLGRYREIFTGPNLWAPVLLSSVWHSGQVSPIDRRIFRSRRRPRASGAEFLPGLCERHEPDLETKARRHPLWAAPTVSVPGPSCPQWASGSRSWCREV